MLNKHFILEGKRVDKKDGGSCIAGEIIKLKTTLGNSSSQKENDRTPIIYISFRNNKILNRKQ